MTLFGPKASISSRTSQPADRGSLLRRRVPFLFSIRFGLTAWYAGILILTLALTGLALRVMLVRSIDQDAESRLFDAAKEVRMQTSERRIQTNDFGTKPIVVVPDFDVQSMLVSGLSITVIDTTGYEPLFERGVLSPLWPEPEDYGQYLSLREPTYYTIHADGQSIRGLAFPIISQTVIDPTTGKPQVIGVIFTSESLENTARMISRLNQLLVLAGIAGPLVAGVLSSKVALDTNGGQARALLSGWALLVVAALLVPVLVGLHTHARDISPAAHTLSGSQRIVLSTLVLLTTLGFGSWGIVGFQGPTTASSSQLPGYVHDVMSSARASRVLMLQTSTDNELDWNVVDERQPRWGTGERELSGEFAEEFGRLVQFLGAAEVPEDLGEQLRTLGVSHIYMGGFDEQDLASVGNAPGLTRAAVRDGAVLWTVSGRPSRLRLVGQRSGTPVIDGTVAAQDNPRQLVLAEAADTRWWASIDGVALQRNAEQQGVVFTVPEDVGGDIDWGLRHTWVALGLQIAVALLILTLLAPTLGTTTTARRVKQ